MQTYNYDKYQNYFKNHFQKKFLAADIDEYYKWFWSQWNFMNSHVVNLCQGKILEIGSGLGGLFRFIAPNMHENCTGIELDLTALEFASSFFPAVDFQNKSIEDFESNLKFNKVFAFEVLEHLENPILAIAKIASILDESGIFIGSSPYPYEKNILSDKTHNFVLHPQNWRRLFLNCGFKKVDVYPFSNIPYLWRINKRLNPRIPFYITLPLIVTTTFIIARK